MSKKRTRKALHHPEIVTTEAGVQIAAPPPEYLTRSTLSLDYLPLTAANNLAGELSDLFYVPGYQMLRSLKKYVSAVHNVAHTSPWEEGVYLLILHTWMPAQRTVYTDVGWSRWAAGSWSPLATKRANVPSGALDPNVPKSTLDVTNYTAAFWLGLRRPFRTRAWGIQL